MLRPACLYLPIPLPLAVFAVGSGNFFPELGKFLSRTMDDPGRRIGIPKSGCNKKEREDSEVKEGQSKAAQPKSKRKVMVRFVIGGAIGGILGFLYYRLAGCPTGGCPLTSNPYTSTLYGMVLGALIGGRIGL